MFSDIAFFFFVVGYLSRMDVHELFVTQMRSRSLLNTVTAMRVLGGWGDKGSFSLSAKTKRTPVLPDSARNENFKADQIFKEIQDPSIKFAQLTQLSV